MAENPECQVRRRRSSGNPNLPLNLDVGYQVNESVTNQGTPSPGCIKFVPSSKDPSTSSALLEFRKKQQSFDIQIEECDEEEIVLDSDDEADGEENGAAGVDRAATPTPIQDFAANVVYTEGPHVTDFLKVRALENDCITDVSDADDDEGEE